MGRVAIPSECSLTNVFYVLGQGFPDDFNLDTYQVSTAAENSVPQEVADAVCDELVRALRWFHNSNDQYLGDPTVRAIPDAEVRARIAGAQEGYHREAKNRQGLLEYDITALPFDRQRAWCERVERIWSDWLAAHPEWRYDTEHGLVHRERGFVGGPDGLRAIEDMFDWVSYSGDPGIA